MLVYHIMQVACATTITGQAGSPCAMSSNEAAAVVGKVGSKVKSRASLPPSTNLFPWMHVPGVLASHGGPGVRSSGRQVR
jgi:hypothetical protein